MNLYTNVERRILGMQEIDCNLCYFASLIYRGISVCDVMAKYGGREAATRQQFSSSLSNDREDKKHAFYDFWTCFMA